MLFIGRLTNTETPATDKVEAGSYNNIYIYISSADTGGGSKAKNAGVSNKKLYFILP